MAERSYAELLEAVRQGRVVYWKGRSAATVAELEFIASCPEPEPVTGITELTHPPAEPAHETQDFTITLPDQPAERSKAFTPEYIQETSPEDEASATALSQAREGADLSATGGQLADRSAEMEVPDVIPGYDELTAAELVARFRDAAPADLPVDLLTALRLYEEQHKNRSTVLEMLDQRLAAAAAVETDTNAGT